ncbi:brain-specific angiogenesis inhibitor 1-associated protein 2-like protein 1b isoform X3 [Gadus macrocephalus]|uniref:brain-specific angiogenesis inhibitor 1-associated protein 2-like protein 1b isoform X3 n=1 Tax=Gadus macrocephalus TaxID=80720 RepID=UPI0028CB318B|nr:brain-specific angiogenesis inhibitor 1-associated protein 2-like protein 1b isoform X3 [Gadus macrocephalus]
MSRGPEEANKLTESTYKNVMDQFNPGLRNLVNLGKSYEKSVAAMSLAGKMYFDAVSKIGENAAVSPASRELGAVLMEISDVHKKVHLELEENFKRFHREIISELEKKTDLDVKYMTATYKRYQMEHKMKQDSLERSQSELKKLRRKSQGKNANKYESKENECLETLGSRQLDMQNFMADGCMEALLEEKRRYCFLVDKHCTFSDQISAFHDKAGEMLRANLASWQDQCNSATEIPDSVLSMIEGLRVPIPITPLPSPSPSRHSMNLSMGRDSISAPPAPPLKTQTSPLANMFNQNNISASNPAINGKNFTDRHSDPHGPSEEAGMPRSLSVATGLNSMVTRPRVRTVFPHTAGSNATLLSFQEGELITLLIPDEKDGWMYGELEKTRQRGWFPSSYCRVYSEPLVSNNSRSVVNLHHQDTETDEATMVLPPTDYREQRSRTAAGAASASAAAPSGPSPLATAATAPVTMTTMATTATANNNGYRQRYSPTPSTVSSISSSNQSSATQQANGISRPPPPFLTGGNPFATVRLRPTVTNDRSAPAI